MSTKDEVITQIQTDFDYSREELLSWEWVNMEEHPDGKNVYWDNRGIYVLFAEDKIIWYNE